MSCFNKFCLLLWYYAIESNENIPAKKTRKDLCFICKERKSERLVERLGTNYDLEKNTIASLEKFVCKFFLQKTKLSDVGEVRKLLFRMQQSHSESLPPTKAALIPAILRAHYQCIVWKDLNIRPNYPPPEKYGWVNKNNVYEEIMTTLPPAPDALINLIQCKCKKSQCSNLLCSCKKAKLKCTDLCGCSMQNDFECANTIADNIEDANSDDENMDEE